MRASRPGALILCYHNVVPDGASVGGDLGLHMPLSLFLRQIRWLAAHYEVLALRELTDRLASAQPVRRMASVTFDDGYGGVFEHALPALAQLGMSATLFVVADAPDAGRRFWWDHPTLTGLGLRERLRLLETYRGDGRAILHALGASTNAAHVGQDAPDVLRPATWSMVVAAVRAGAAVGVHSASHRNLPQLSDSELQDEIVVARSTIRGRLGVEPEFFAYPYGQWTKRVRHVVAAAGYRAAVTLESGFNSPTTDPMALRRLNVPARIGDAAFEAWTAGLRLSLARRT